MKHLDENKMSKEFLFFFCMLIFLCSCGAEKFRITAQQNKESVARSIIGYAANVSFAILYHPNRIAFDRCERVLPHAWRFGLSEVESIIDSRWADGIKMPLEDINLLFLYESDRCSNVGRGKQIHAYVGSPHFMPGICRIVFMTAQGKPIQERYSQQELMPGGVCVIPFEKFWSAKRISQNQFMETFSCHVFKICDGGAFTVEYGCAQRVLHNMRHSAGSAALYDEPNKDSWNNQLYLNDVVLDGREISEIVFWLWSRDGKAATYPELCRRHPELFEPIRGFNEFKSEIGQMLLAHGKK